MVKKRKSGGRSRKGGNAGNVQCSCCGRFVPKDKVKTVTKQVSLVDYKLKKELLDQGTILPRTTVVQNYCVSCAIHRHVLASRPKEERKDHTPLR
nr:30S ribosomal protein S26e [Candidatus Sigynarchaeota archaeon]